MFRTAFEAIGRDQLKATLSADSALHAFVDAGDQFMAVRNSPPPSCLTLFSS